MMMTSSVPTPMYMGTEYPSQLVLTLTTSQSAAIESAESACTRSNPGPQATTSR